MAWYIQHTIHQQPSLKRNENNTANKQPYPRSLINVCTSSHSSNRFHHQCSPKKHMRSYPPNPDTQSRRSPTSYHNHGPRLSLFPLPFHSSSYANAQQNRSPLLSPPTPTSIACATYHQCSFLAPILALPSPTAYITLVPVWFANHAPVL